MVWIFGRKLRFPVDDSSSRTQPFRWGTGWSQRHPLTTITRKLIADLFGCSRLIFDNGEFDPGSERTLAAWIRHASRTRKSPSGDEYSGERVSNGWETCLSVGDNIPNGVLIPNNITGSLDLVIKGGLFLKATAWG